MHFKNWSHQKDRSNSLQIFSYTCNNFILSEWILQFLRPFTSMFGNIWIDSYVLIYSSYLMMYIVKLNTFTMPTSLSYFAIKHTQMSVKLGRCIYGWNKTTIFQRKCDQTLRMIVKESVRIALHQRFIHHVHTTAEWTNSLFWETLFWTYQLLGYNVQMTKLLY